MQYLPSDEQQDSLMNTLGMEFLDSVPGECRARMFVDGRVCHPFGYLSGGASLALAETLAGRSSYILCEKAYFPLGLDVTGHHFHPVPRGQWVYADAKLLHQGNTIHLWEITITDEQQNLISSIRVTNYLIKQDNYYSKSSVPTEK